MERKIMSIQDWGPGDCLQIGEALRNLGLIQGRKARILQCHQSQGKLRGRSRKIHAQSSWGLVLGQESEDQERAVRLGPESSHESHFIIMVRGGEARVQVVKS